MRLKVFFTEICSLLLLMLFSLNAQAATGLNKTSLTMESRGPEKVQSFQLKVIDGRNVKWSSSNKKVATVGNKGLVKAYQAGVATIKAQSGDQIYKCKVTVKKPAVKDVTLYEKTELTVVPGIGKVSKVTVKSKDIASATVRDGKAKLKGLKVGSSSYTITTSLGNKCTAKLYVKHEFSKTTTKATCTESAYVINKCKHCSKVEKTPYGSKLGHSYPDTWTIVKAASCTAKGSKKKICSRCSNVLTQTISMINHEYDKNQITVVHPTVTSTGYVENSCVNCHQLIRTITPAIGHYLIPVETLPFFNKLLTANKRPYLFGHENPLEEGSDCSGLVYWALLGCGIEPYDSGSEGRFKVKDGTIHKVGFHRIGDGVPEHVIKKLLAGDLLVNDGHVVVFIRDLGDGCFLSFEAKGSQYGIGYFKATYAKYKTAYRFWK